MCDPMEIDEDSGTGADSNVVSSLLPAVAEMAQRAQGSNGAGHSNRRKRSYKRAAAASRRKQSGRRLRAKRANKGDLLQVNDVSSRLVRADPLTFFADHCEMALAGWISILGKTTLPHITSRALEILGLTADELICLSQARLRRKRNACHG
ncbi:hypothetical protein QBC46DRAFT_422979 [Diplogelasinospora grovesii]|uniref:Uncharacterized protein n=1 Tax=Diplogelasinospora grovesii TaxID=303347 RepID=A0AAN6MXR0_9PEZI|nr:hypothetical protein QBC46DRAFT_422979 [Diplogelasinospora grovesii]